MPEHFPIDRRSLLSGTFALAAVSPVSGLNAQPKTCFSDVHVHLFNSSDLPIAGFAKYVLGPAWIGNFAGAEAAVDALSYLGKRIGISAQREYERLGGARRATFSMDAGDVSLERFGKIAADLIESRQAQAATSPSLKDSYRQLEADLLADANYPGDVVTNSFSTVPQKRRLATAIGIAARKAESGAVGDWQGGALSQYRMNYDLKFLPGLISLGGAGARTLGWVYLMTRSRLSHLETFLDAYAGDGRTACTLISHLVDYDYWVDDTPRSEQLQQIKVMDRLRGVAARRGVDLRTFAGFCPLRLAIERLRPGPAFLDRALELHRTGAIAGFKLYPPMGFYPLGNASKPDSDFEPGQAYRESPVAKWRMAGGTGGLGKALDAALREFYAAVAARRIPIMAHGRHSNGAGPRYSERAAPQGWEAVVREFPIRLLLGHLIDGSVAFIDSTNGHDGSWDLAATKRLLATAHPNGAQVFGDLGYIEDVLTAGRGAEFFVKLKSFFGDSATKRIVYGSDWIMLAREKNDRKYLGIIADAMAAAKYSPDEIAAVLNGNARSFLGLPA